MRIKNRLNNLRNQLILRLRDLSTARISLSLIFAILFVFMTSIIVNSISRGLDNYNTFLEERSQLEEIKSENERLLNEFEYVNSDEFKKIILRDTLGYADQDERLFRTKIQTQYFDKEIKLLSLEEIADYGQWWKLIVE